MQLTHDHLESNFFSFFREPSASQVYSSEAWKTSIYENEKVKSNPLIGCYNRKNDDLLGIAGIFVCKPVQSTDVDLFFYLKHVIDSYENI